MPVYIAVGLLAGTPLASAHHSRANFLLDETITFEGTIADYAWKNPHVFLEVKTAGSSEPWLIEAHSLTGLKRMGWSSDTFAVGDKVVIVGNPDRNPDRQFVLLDHIIADKGETLYSFRRPEDRGGEPRSAPRVAPSTDFTGTWTRVSTLRQALVGGFVPPTDWPVTERGQAGIDAFTLDDNPAYNCISLGMPRITLSPYLIRWTRLEDRIVIEKEHSDFSRSVRLDQARHPENLERNPVGHSIGIIGEDGSLSVDTIGMPAARWGLSTGLDSSEELHVRERYTLTDDGLGMDVSYTITDPVYLTEPVTVEGRYRKVPDSPLTPFECDQDTARRHLTAETD